jgi:hypothetical protein
MICHYIISMKLFKFMYNAIYVNPNKQIFCDQFQGFQVLVELNECDE